MMKKLFFIIQFLFAGAIVNAQPGTLDNTFGNNGIVITDFENGGDSAWAITTQSDGKIIVVGGVDLLGNFDQDFGVARYNLDGSLDNTFDSDGLVSTAIGSDYDEAYSVAVQQDGKILVAGQSWINNIDFALVRYNPDGSLDNSFSNNGIAITDFGGFEDSAQAIAIQQDGKILVTGYSSINDGVFATSRHNQDGSLDISFDTDGKVITNIGSDFDGAHSIALQQDNKIIVAGVSSNGSAYDFAIVRYNTDGSLDTSFNSTGISTTDFGGDYDAGQSVVIQPDGKILVTGVARFAGVISFALARYNSNGSLDNAFGADGRVITDFGSGSAYGRSVILQPDNKIVVAGGLDNGANGGFALVRYNSDGTLDNSFGTNGKTTTVFGSYSWGSSGTLQPDGKIVMAGLTGHELVRNFAVVRYNSGLLGVDDVFSKYNLFSTYPSPTSGILNIQSKTTITQIEIYNQLGQLVVSNSNQITIDISSASQGVYFIKVMDENGAIGTQKIVKK